MKVGILTFHRALNYGAVLQCYALQESIKSLGYETYVIDYIDEIMNNGILDNVEKCGKRLAEKLNEIKQKHLHIKEVRGMGLMQGMELDIPVADVVKASIDNGLLLVGAGANVIRFVPGLIITEQQIDEAMEIFDRTLTEVLK